MKNLGINAPGILWIVEVKCYMNLSLQTSGPKTKSKDQSMRSDVGFHEITKNNTLFINISLPP
ncbi:MAG TPA: hypothetical protein PLX15_00585 [Candidatus Woesearchaeota archaeon]|nr:hypothetical protein [Candidatus Woesearchaeota archaeon]